MFNVSNVNNNVVCNCCLVVGNGCGNVISSDLKDVLKI